MIEKQIDTKNSEQNSELDVPVPGYSAELGTRLKWIVDKIGTQKRAGQIAGVKPEMIGKYISGKAKPSFYAILALADEAGVSIDWLASGNSPHGEGASDEFVGVPRYDVNLAAGAGAFNERAEMLDYIPFTREFLSKKIGRNTAEGLVLLEVRGDSMEPTIGSGDLVLLDTNDKTLEDGIVGFVLDDTAYVKRIRHTPDGIDVISDNRAVYDPFHLDQGRLGEFHMIGRVRWIGRVLGG